MNLQNGNKQTVTIEPKDVLSDGTYVFQREIMAQHAGAFNITATVEGSSTDGAGGTNENSVAQNATPRGDCYSDFHCQTPLVSGPVTKAECKAAGGKTWQDPSQGCISVLASF